MANDVTLNNVRDVRCEDESDWRIMKGLLFVFVPIILVLETLIYIDQDLDRQVLTDPSRYVAQPKFTRIFPILITGLAMSGMYIFSKVFANSRIAPRVVVAHSDI